MSHPEMGFFSFAKAFVLFRIHQPQMGKVSNSQSEEKCNFYFLSLNILFDAPGAEVRGAFWCMRCSLLAVVYIWN